MRDARYTGRPEYRFGTMNGEPIILAQAADGRWGVAEAPAILLARWRRVRRRDLCRVLREAIAATAEAEAENRNYVEREDRSE